MRRVRWKVRTLLILWGEKKTTKKTNGLIGVPGSSAITFPEYTRSQITISWRVSDDGGMQMSNWTIFFSSYNATWNIISFPANTSQYPHYLFSCFMVLLDVSRNKFLGLNASTLYYFQVQATNIYGSGPISNAQVFATADRMFSFLPSFVRFIRLFILLLIFFYLSLLILIFSAMCGDGTCDANETCSECHFDCCGMSPKRKKQKKTLKLIFFFFLFCSSEMVCNLQNKQHAPVLQ